LVLPIAAQDEAFSAESGDGFQTVAFADGAKTVTFTTTHLLLVAPVNGSKGISAHLPALIDHIDNYFDALRDDVTLSDTLLEPAQVKVEQGNFQYGGVVYVGCAFRHTWLIEV
jgi:hypothetical protein